MKLGSLHWYTCNDAEKRISGEHKVAGSLVRSGRFYLYGRPPRPLGRLFWSFWHTLYWFEAALKFGGENSSVSVSIILPRLAHAGISIGVPPRWLSKWMIEDRVFSLKFGYVGTIAEANVAYAEWAEDCGMTDYYRRETPRKYSAAQLWPGWRLKLRPPPLRWFLGRTEYGLEVLEQKPIVVELDGLRYEGTWKLEKRWRTRPYWPWPYKVSYSSNIDMPNPPQFSGKGENSWDCGDDAIYGMGTRELTAAGAVGEYVKAVLKNRQRYGMPSQSA